METNLSYTDTEIKTMTLNKSQMEIPAERRQDFVWHVEQINKKTYLKFDAGENRENVEYE